MVDIPAATNAQMIGRVRVALDGDHEQQQHSAGCRATTRFWFCILRQLNPALLPPLSWHEFLLPALVESTVHLLEKHSLWGAETSFWFEWNQNWPAVLLGAGGINAGHTCSAACIMSDRP